MQLCYACTRMSDNCGSDGHLSLLFQDLYNTCIIIAVASVSSVVTHMHDVEKKRTVLTAQSDYKSLLAI